MKALTFNGKLHFIDDAPVPRREGEALVEVICAGICNTDLEIVKGYANFFGIPGHEFVGRVVSSPDAEFTGKRVVGEINAGCGVCKLCSNGDSRHCSDRTVLGIKGRDGAFADFLSLPVRNLKVLPDHITNETGVFVEPLAAALNILEQVTITGRDEIAVVGDGKLAQLVVLVLSNIGCSITVLGRHVSKLEIARRLGANFDVVSSPDAAAGLARRFDLVIEASGSETGMRTALGIVRPRGSIVLKTTHHGNTSLELSQIVVNEVTIVGSRCGRFEPAIDIIPKVQSDLSRLISHRFPLEQGLRAFEAAASPESMKVILQIGS